MKETAIPREEDYCDWCNGFGSSLKDPIGVDTCTRCGGTGLKPNKKVILNKED